LVFITRVLLIFKGRDLVQRQFMRLAARLS
jgi:hypothetical protein